MALLGPTIAHIAREKAAIIERGDIAVTGADGEALRIVRRRAARMGVPLTEVAPPPLLAIERDGIVVSLQGLGRTFVGLRGRHQAANAAVANATLDALAAAGIARARPKARREGFATASWPGRLELLRARGRDVLLDGAHNPAGAASLAVALDDLLPLIAARADGDAPAPTLLMAAMGDKDVEGIVGALARAGALDRARIICTRLGVPRAAPAERLAAAWAAVDGRRTADGARTIVAEPDVGAA